MARATAAAKPQLQRMVRQSLTAGGQRLGTAIGGQIGMSGAGAKMGSALGARISKLIGSGDYVATGLTSHNTLIRNSMPATISFGDRTIRIAHREYICDVLAGADHPTFNSRQFVVNANYTTTFPYLSGIATQFEKYRFKGLVFEFVSTTTPYASAGTSVGTVVMAAQFNTASPDFQTKTQMENVENAISIRMDQNALYGVECKDQVQNWYYTRHIGSAANATTNVSNIYDLCDFSIATVGGSSASASNPVGELWVTYDVELTGPRLPDSRYGYFHSFCSDPSTATPLGGSSRTVKQYGMLNNITVTGSTVSFQNAVVGDIYSVQYTCLAATAGGSIITFGGTGYEYVKLLSGGVSGFTSNPRTLTSTNTASADAYIRITKPLATLNFTGTTIGMSGGFEADLVITPVAFSVKDSDL